MRQRLPESAPAKPCRIGDDGTWPAPAGWELEEAWDALEAAAVGPIAIAVVALIATAGAAAIVLEAGDLVIHAEGGVSPTTLPKKHNAPISIHGGGALSTRSGDLPPILKTITLEFDRHGAVETRGLEVCRPGKLQSTTVPVARRACPGAIVGKGAGRAIVAFPEQKPIAISSPITLFNGPRSTANRPSSPTPIPPCRCRRRWSSRS